MKTFDPAKQRIIAADRVTGEHSHVELPDLLQEVQIVATADDMARKRITELEQQVAELHDAIARIVAASNDQLKAIRAVDARINGLTLESVKRRA